MKRVRMVENERGEGRFQPTYPVMTWKQQRRRSRGHPELIRGPL